MPLSRINAVGRETKSEEYQDLQMFQELEQLYSKDKQTYEILQNSTAHPQFIVLNQKIFKTRCWGGCSCTYHKVDYGIL